jgi:PAS domain S-box-containing protein
VVIAIGTDITERRRIEEEVRQKNLMLITINELEREFADLSMGTSVEELAAKKLSALSGAIVTIFLMYDPITRMLKPTVFKFAPGIRERLPSALEKVRLILGKSLEDIQIPVSEKMYHDMNRSVIGMKKTITELSYGKIRPLVSEGIQKLSGIDRFIHIAHIIDGELYGASVIGLRPDQPDTSQELLESFSHMVAVSLRRQQAEMALRESEASYRGLFNTVRQAIYILDHEGKFIDVNDGAEAMYGYARNEFIDRTPEFLSAPGKNNFAAVMEQIREAFVGEPQQFEFWGLRKNGEIFPKDVRLYKGTYFGRDVVIAIGTDITERKQRE